MQEVKGVGHVMSKRLLFFAIFLFTAIFFLPRSAVAMTASVENGKKIYDVHCFQCHGFEGRGDGSAATYLARRPRDFTEGLYKLKTSPPNVSRVRDEDIYHAISNGMSSAGMPPWKNVLSAQERWNLVAYLKSLTDLFDDTENPPPLNISGRIPYSKESVQRGEMAYRELKCPECHGPLGEGPPKKELKDDYGQRIWPRDLTRSWTFIGPYTPQAMYARITNGIPLTPMPAHVLPVFKDKLEGMRWDVVNYIMWLADTAEKRRAKQRMIISIIILVSLAVTAPYYIPYLRRRWAIRKIGRRS